MATETNGRYAHVTTPPFIQGSPREGLFTPTVDQKHRLGTLLYDEFGRRWRYAKNGATQLEVALMAQSEAVNANVLNEVQTAYGLALAAKSGRVLVTTSNGISDGELQDGWLAVQDGTGEGYLYPIQWNEWITGDTVMQVTLYEEIRLAIAATAEITLIKNKWRDVIVMPTTVTGIWAGVPNVVIPVNYYGWLQTKGPCPMVVDAGDTLVVGALAGNPATNGTAGGVGIPAITTQVWGHAITIGAAGETAVIDLNLE